MTILCSKKIFLTRINDNTNTYSVVQCVSNRGERESTMMPWFAMAAVAIVCLVSRAQGAALSVTSKVIYDRTLEVQTDHITVMVMEVTFDRDVYVKNAVVGDNHYGSTPKPLGDFRNKTLGGGDGESMPDIVAIGGIASFSCGDINVQGYGETDGPPQFLISAPPTSEPAVSLIASIGGVDGVFGRQVWATNKLAFGFILSVQPAAGGDSGSGFSIAESAAELLGECTPTLHFPGATDAQGNPDSVQACSLDGTAFTGTVAFTTQNAEPANQCTASRVDTFASDFVQALEWAATAHSQDASKSIEFLLGSFSARSAWDACKGTLDTYVTTAVATEMLPPPSEEQIAAARQYTGYQCTYHFGTPQYAQDPCCNRTLARTQCCAPRAGRSTFIHYDRVIGYDTTALEQTCSHPGPIRTILGDYVAARQRAQDDQARRDADAAAAAETSGNGGGGDAIGNLYAVYTAFIQKCQTEVFSQSCTIDADCKYGPKVCDTTNTCRANWFDSSADVAACMVAEMPSDLAYGLARRWSLSHPTAQAFAAEFQRRVFSLNCVGPRSQDFQRTYDPRDGHLTSAGDEAGCMNPAGCNWNPWQNGCQGDCVGDSINATYGGHMCGMLQGNAYRDYSMPARCYISDPIYQSDPSNCYNAGFTLINTNGGFGPSACVDAAHTADRTDCVTAGGQDPFTNCIDSPNDWPCQQDVCFYPSNCAAYVSAFPVMEILQGAFDRWGACMFRPPCTNCGGGGAEGHPPAFSGLQVPTEPLSRSKCAAINMTLHTGRRWQDGAWSTEQQCDQGVCSVWSMQSPDVTPEQCADAVQCNQQCSYCRVSRNAPQFDATVCYFDTDNIDQNTCAGTLGGQWVSNGLTGSDTVYRCVLPQFSSDEQGCTAVPSSSSSSYIQTATFGRCYTTLTTRDVCEDRAANTWHGQYLGCVWDDRANCVDASMCTSQGRCNDDDFSFCSPPQNGNPLPDCRTEFCVLPYRYDDFGNKLAASCPVDNTSPSSAYRDTRVGCLNATVVTELECTTVGGVWHIKATTEEECAAHGTACINGEVNPQRWMEWTQRNATECGLCGGSILPAYQWQTGTVLPSEMLPLTWQDRAWQHVNQWRPTFDWQKMQQEINAVVGDIAARTLVNQAASTYSAMLPIMKVLSCDCSETPGTDCFSSISPLVLDANCAQDPSTTTLCGGVLLSNTTASAGNGTAGKTFQVLRALAGMVVNGITQTTGLQSVHRGRNHLFNKIASAASRKLLAAPDGSNAPLYSIVKNTHGAVVGQLIGDGVQVPLDAQGSAFICLPRTLTIDLDSNDFSRFDMVSGTQQQNSVKFTLSVPLNLGVVLQGTSVCALVPEPGTYFPIFRAANWETIQPTGTAGGGGGGGDQATGSSSSSSSTAVAASSSSSSTAEAIAEKGGSSSSSSSTGLSNGALAGILVAGSILGLCVIALCVRTCMHMWSGHKYARVST